MLRAFLFWVFGGGHSAGMSREAETLSQQDMEFLRNVLYFTCKILRIGAGFQPNSFFYNRSLWNEYCMASDTAPPLGRLPLSSRFEATLY
jgi:hypothetical protein